MSWPPLEPRKAVKIAWILKPDQAFWEEALMQYIICLFGTSVKFGVICFVKDLVAQYIAPAQLQ